MSNSIRLDAQLLCIFLPMCSIHGSLWLLLSVFYKNAPLFLQHLTFLFLIPGFRLQDVNSAKLAQRRKNKNVSNDNSRSFSSTSSSLSSTSSGTSSLKTPCSSTQPASSTKPVKRINKDASSSTVFDFGEARVQEYLSSLSSSSSSSNTSPASSSMLQLQLSPVRKKKKADISLTLPTSSKLLSEQVQASSSGTKRKHKELSSIESSQCSKSIAVTHTSPARKKKKQEKASPPQCTNQTVSSSIITSSTLSTATCSDLTTVFEEQLLGPITRARRRQLNTEMSLVETAAPVPVTVPRQRMCRKTETPLPPVSHSKKGKRQKTQ